MVHNLRSALGRARFSEQEVRTFRGVVTALSKGRGRVLEARRERRPRRRNGGRCALCCDRPADPHPAIAPWWGTSSFEIARWRSTEAGGGWDLAAAASRRIEPEAARMRAAADARSA